jgi:hypothetical protein
MSKRARLIAVAVAVVLMLGAGVTTFVLAQDSPAEEPTPTERPGQTLLGRVADILGIEEEALVDAFEQARQEMRQEAEDRCLQWAIERDCIDEETADRIREWTGNVTQTLRDFGGRIHDHLRDALGDLEWSRPMPCR